MDSPAGPLVSVVMPVYNAGKYLHAAIESILKQSYRNLELIIINDGSTDNSKSIILGFQDSRVRYFENPENWGIVRSRNRSLEEATGKYIAVMDSDDIALPDRIKLEVEFLENNDDYGMCGSSCQIIDGHDKILKRVDFPATAEETKSLLLIDNCVCHSAVLMRSNLAKELKYNPAYEVAEDFELWYRISKIKKIVNLPVVTTMYRIHNTNTSTSKGNQMVSKISRLHSKIFDDFHIPYSAEEQELYSNFIFYKFKYFENREKINELENWIFKLLAEFGKHEDISMDIMYATLIKKWIVICSSTQQYKKMFFSKLIARDPSVYMKILYKKIKKSIK